MKLPNFILESSLDFTYALNGKEIIKCELFNSTFTQNMQNNRLFCNIILENSTSFIKRKEDVGNVLYVFGNTICIAISKS